MLDVMDVLETQASMGVAPSCTTSHTLRPINYTPSIKQLDPWDYALYHTVGVLGVLETQVSIGGVAHFPAPLTNHTP